MKQINFKHLSKNQAKVVNSIIESALSAADPYKAVCRALKVNEKSINICGKEYDRASNHRIFLIGMGKAVGPMAAGVVDKIGPLIHSGVIVGKQEIKGVNIPESIKVLYGSHPVPSKKSQDGAKAILRLLADTTKDDLLISLISGGGSALVTTPRSPITIVDMRELTRLLLESGANIQEINTIRKHLDGIKGGGIAEAAGNTPMETLILSDVIGDDVSMIASGPTCADASTFGEAYTIIQKYDLEEKIPEPIISVIEAGLSGDIRETLKPDAEILSNKQNHIVGSLEAAVRSVIEKAETLGLNTQVISTFLSGEAREVGRVSGTIIKTMIRSDLPVKRPALVLGGGETTVTIVGEGKGGRNQEIAFGAMKEIEGLHDCAVVAFATDGEDGPTDAAGAYVTGSTLNTAKSLSLRPEDFGDQNNTYAFFDRTENLIKTGPTGTNVNDLLFLFAF